ncbi:hypothetical protein BH09BAC1_BH09BAC1_03750 [soil metagenome]
MATNKEIVAKVNEAFTKGDVEAFLACCAEDFTWDMVGDFKSTDKKAVREFMGDMKPGDAPTFTVDAVIGEGDRVVCDGDMQMKTKEGKDWKGRYCDMYIIKDGLVQELKSYVVEYKKEKKD